jgi:hypothetical protein
MEHPNQLGTIASKISTIRWHHRAPVGYEPENDTGHVMSMRSLKRLSKPVTKKLPLTARMLRGIFGLLYLSQSGHQLVWGLVLIGYIFLLRRDEFLKVYGKWKKCVLMFGDAQLYDANEEPYKAQRATMVGIVLRGGKNNQFGRYKIPVRNGRSAGVPGAWVIMDTYGEPDPQDATRGTNGPSRDESWGRERAHSTITERSGYNFGIE